MNTKEFARKLVESVGFSVLNTKEAEKVIDRVFYIAAETLANGEEVNITGFGSFKIKKREPREITMPHGGKAKLKFTKWVKFTPSYKLKNRVNS